MPPAAAMDEDAVDKEKRRRKQFKRMAKILGNCWDLEPTFQDRLESDTDPSLVLCLTDVGTRIDEQTYRLGKHGWEDFARDLGGVFNRHAHGTGKSATAAKKHIKTVQELLSHVNETLPQLASDHVPGTVSATAVGKKKRRSTNDGAPFARNKKSKSSNNDNPTHAGASSSKNAAILERQERAMIQLVDFVQQRGGRKKDIASFESRVTYKKNGTKRFDVNFYNADGRRFRSMMEVGRFLGLVLDDSPKLRRRPRNLNSEHEAEKRRIRKELEKLRKTYQRASKSLDDFTTANNESRYPMDDRLLLEEQMQERKNGDMPVAPIFAAALIPEIAGFPGIPSHCTPEVLMTWDFLCTFERALSLTPIALDDFASALTYQPPEGHVGDDVLVPPVYLAEVHLSLLKLLFADRSSDDWWWSTLETEETEGIKIEDSALETVEDDDDDEGVDKHNGEILLDRPVIKIDFAAALQESEDPLLTASWLSSLDQICGNKKIDKATVKNAIRDALNVVSNKWVAAYLRKTLQVCRASGVALARRSIHWLVARMREARPDLREKASRTVVQEAKEKVIAIVNKQMENLANTAPKITNDDFLLDVEYDEEESDDESDEEGMDEQIKELPEHDTRDESEKPASALPPKPIPSMVDLMLPPSKPLSTSEFVDSFTWSHMVGATASRVLHRKKRLLNEVDDSIRESRGLQQLVVKERREREKLAPSRTLTECIQTTEDPSPVDKAANHLASGGNYLDLSSIERLCLLRLLVEAAYDTNRVREVVDGNYKQRTSAMKALEVERRRAKREAKEKAFADESAAREQLAANARERFLDEKREEIRQLNAQSQEFSEDVIESLTDEDIIDFDDDIRADYEALPTPDSFNKLEVSKMITRLQEESAFDTDVLRVFTLEELEEKEKRELEEMEGQFAGFGGEEGLADESLDRETIRSIERLRREIAAAHSNAQTFPHVRLKALEQLKDAIDDGTIKVLRSAYNAAKKAKLLGTDDETGGIWAVDLVRDAALELENAKQNKRVLDAQKDLVAKRNKCFIRTDPIGRDRYGNRFWMLNKRIEGEEDSDHVWIEAEFSLKDKQKASGKPPPGYLDLRRDAASISYGASDMEDDLVSPAEEKERFCLFSRKEYHSTGFAPALGQYFWGCQVSEDALRGVIRNLDANGIRENELKTILKESLEQRVAGIDKQEAIEEKVNAVVDEEQDDAESNGIRLDGDEAVFIEAKDAAKNNVDVDLETFESLYSGIGASVRVRHVVDALKDPPVARYENGTVNAWRLRNEEVALAPKSKIIDDTDDEMELDDVDDTAPRTRMVEIPTWRVVSERGHTWWLTGAELTESLSRFKKWSSGRGYFETDSAFFSYRNTLGRHCGKASEAAYSSSPYMFAKIMLRREAELYPRLKLRSYDNNWGGQSGARALWTNSMKDYAYDFSTVKQGLKTLENAIFELTGEFTDYENTGTEPNDVQTLLQTPSSAFEIELESLDKSVLGLWNSRTSRAIFLHIVEQSTTTGFLALALDLLYRNAVQYLVNHNLLDLRGGHLGDTSKRGEVVTTSSGRTTRARRMNMWQQQQQAQEDFWSLPN